MTQEKGLITPGVTLDDIENAIDDIAAIQFHTPPGTAVTVACALLKNGYTIVGKSVCAGIENFDEELGRKLAVDNAKQQLWPLLGFSLRGGMTKLAAKEVQPMAVIGSGE